MNAYERTLQEDLVELPETQQLEILQVLTLQNIAAQDVITWLRERKLWFEGQQGYRGPVQAAYEGTDNTELKDAIDYLWATLFGDQMVSQIRTTEPQWAMEVNGVLEVVLGLTDLPEDEEEQLRISFYEMGGGRPWLAIDTAGLTEAKAEYEARVAADEQIALERENQRLADEAAETLKAELRAFVAARSAVALERVESGEITSQAGIVAVVSAEQIEAA